MDEYIMQLSMLRLTPHSMGIVVIWWRFHLVGSLIPHGWDNSQNLIPTYYLCKWKDLAFGKNRRSNPPTLVPSSNPHLKPVITCTWGWGLTLIGALLTRVCRFHAFQDEHHAVTGEEYSWSESEMKQIANCFLVSFFCKLLPNLLAETL